MKSSLNRFSRWKPISGHSKFVPLAFRFATCFLRNAKDQNEHSRSYHHLRTHSYLSHTRFVPIKCLKVKIIPEYFRYCITTERKTTNVLTNMLNMNLWVRTQGGNLTDCYAEKLSKTKTRGPLDWREWKGIRNQTICWRNARVCPLETRQTGDDIPV